ncbi:hypothetical protein FBU30_007758 [Linnemannia zychae]|nr:hypothetical protein FBU30_007758 [Linnemannia zychae]
MAFSNTPLPEVTRGKRIRLAVMRLATVERLQLLWALLALFVLVATVGTSLSAIWQSLCPFLIRQSQRALLPRVINHPSTQTATIAVSIILTILNFFSWIILAADGDMGAHTDCKKGPLADKPGYVSQCQSVNVAIATNAIVFLLWIPISLVIICGTIERGLWWWGEDDGWAQGEMIVGGSNMMSEEEFDRKIGGTSGSKWIKRRQTVFPAEEEQPEGMVMIQQPKPAFVTPIASQFRSTNGAFGTDLENGDDDDFATFTPSSYRRHQQQRQQQQQRQRLQRKASTTSLSSRLSSFFGAGWGSDAMPPAPEGEQLPAMPTLPAQYAEENARNAAAAAAAASSAGGAAPTVKATTARKKKEVEKKQEEEEEKVEDIPLHGDSYASQWHSRWS